MFEKLKFASTNLNLKQKPILISMGEPSGIGAEICLKLVLNAKFQDYISTKNPNLKLVVLGNFKLLVDVAKKFNLAVNLIKLEKLAQAPVQKSNNLSVLNFELADKVKLGTLNVKNAAFVLNLIDFGAKQALAGEARSLVTAPIHKGIINSSGLNFSGHTEYLQNLCNAPEVVMMLVSDQLRVALATTHLPLKDVASAINAPMLATKIEILVAHLQNFYKIDKPYIGVCGLNPHAGEGGYLGSEELEIIDPLLQKMRTQGYNLTNALPADTIFTPNALKDKDAILAMYHDQGLPTLKYIGWDKGVNITLGLPIVRTSPDHGTALNIAHLGTASESSLVSALIEADKHK